MKYKNLIKKILKEDFDWVESAPEIITGELFDDDDVRFEENNAYNINIYDGKITYNLTWDEIVSKVFNGYDDWYLNVMMTSNGEPYGYDDYLDDDEINYFGGYLSPEHKNRFKKILEDLKVIGELPSDTDVNTIIESSFHDQFSELEEYIGTTFYSGSDDWDDMVSDALSAISSNVERNRWINMRSYYDDLLLSHKITVDSGWRDEIEITTKFPYRFESGVIITNISELLEYICDDVLGGEWSDVYHDGWDASGAEEDVIYSVESFLDTIEEYIEELKEDMPEVEPIDPNQLSLFEVRKILGYEKFN